MTHIAPGPISGCLRAPASKSHAQRALIAAALTNGVSRILNPGHSADVQACTAVIQALGAKVKTHRNELTIQGGRPLANVVLDCGESGFCLRAMTAVAALFDRPILLEGRGSLMARPIGMVVDTLRQLGVRVETRGDYPPLLVQGPFFSTSAIVDGGASSQFLSGLLLALPHAQRDSVLGVRNLKSTPYVQMTLDLIHTFGGKIEANADLTEFRIPGRQSFQATTLDVEGDWSGAAFLLVAGALAGEVHVEGLLRDSSQADRAILDALQAAGASLEWVAPQTLHVRKSDLHAFAFDATHCPDLFPPLAVLACHCQGTSQITGVSRLHNKESDRASALEEELGTLGAQIRIQDDLMYVTGGPLRGGTLNPRNDHRIAMAGAVAALCSHDGVSIADEHCVAKSYPDFFRHLSILKRCI